MKTTLILLLSFLLFAVTTKALVGATEESFDPVLDTDGDELKAGINYYILPLFRGNGGGATLGLHRNDTCPFDVVQESFDLYPGLPLTFSPVNISNKGVVRLSTDLNIKFTAFTPCYQSTVWKVDDFEESTGQYFVTIGGVEGNHGSETVSNWFKIEKYGFFSNDYKLRFCPSVCDTCKVVCRDVGIYFVDWNTHLALSDEPLIIIFKNAGRLADPTINPELTHEVYNSI